MNNILKTLIFISSLVLVNIFFIWVNSREKEIKTEYKIELTNQDSIKIYSVSNDTIYKCLYTEMEKTIELDNL